VTAIATREALVRLSRPLRLRAAAGWVGLGVGGAALLLGSMAWAARLGWLSAPWWVLAAWVAAIAAVGTAAWPAWRAISRLSAGAVARLLEEQGAWRRGSLTSLLDATAPGTSPALLALADRTQADDLGRRGTDAAAPLAARVRTVALAGGGLLLAGLGAFGSAGPVNGAAAALWRPGHAWEATIAPVRLRVAKPVVDRGDSVEFWLRRSAGERHPVGPGPGESWRPRGVRLDSLGRAMVASSREATLRRVTSGSRGSIQYWSGAFPVFLGASPSRRYRLPRTRSGSPTGEHAAPGGTRLETREKRRHRSPARGGSRPRRHGCGYKAAGSRAASCHRHERLPAAAQTVAGSPIAGDTGAAPDRVVAVALRVGVRSPVPTQSRPQPSIAAGHRRARRPQDHRRRHESRRISRLGVVDSARQGSWPCRRRPDRAILTYTLTSIAGAAAGHGPLLRQRHRQHPERQRGGAIRPPPSTASEVRAAQRQAAGK
jgi:hypothetical protein